MENGNFINLVISLIGVIVLFGVTALVIMFQRPSNSNKHGRKLGTLKNKESH